MTMKIDVMLPVILFSKQRMPAMMKIELTKRAQKRMIENTLEMIKKMCPDWVVYAEPKESFIKTERDTDEASTEAQSRLGRPQLVK
jgi:hypothetical protein